MKKRIIFIILVTIFFGALYAAFSYADKINIGAHKEQEHIIELRDEGFYPENLEINKGDTVTFITTRGRSFWPASSLHPIHSIYPEFDAREPIKSNESWSFTFTSVGEWKYHDHLNSAYTEIIVVKNKDENGEYTLDCSNLDDIKPIEKRQCYRQLLEIAFANYGTAAALEQLRVLYINEPYFIEAGCHKQAHEIGDLAYGEYVKHKDLNKVELPREAITFCGAGFYHGFLEHYLRDNPGTELAKEFCDYLETRQPGVRNTCYHGMGHGFMPDPPDPSTWGDAQAMLDPVLRECDTISKDSTEVLECHEGAFNVILDWMNLQYGLVSNKKDPLGLCRTQITREREHACYYEYAMRIHGLAGDDIEKIAELFIDQIEDDYMATVAIGSAVATVIEAQLDQDDFVKYMLACRNLAERLQKSCTTNIIYGVIYHGEPGQEYVKALLLCGSSKLGEEEKQVCYKKIATYLPVYWPNKREEICSAFEEKYQTFCQ
jgi:plastocyanin